MAGLVIDGAAMLDALPDATAVLDAEGLIVAVNQTWRMFALDNGGDPIRTGVGVNYLDVCARAASAGCVDAYLAAAGLRAVLAGQTVQSELEYPCPSPVIDRWFLLRITPFGGRSGGAVTSHINVTRRSTAEQLLTRQPSHDPLTGLAGNDLFAARLLDMLTLRDDRPARAEVGVLVLDLDDFRSVNERFGRDAGDEVLLTTAHRLLRAVTSRDIVGRLQGDEFAITVPRIRAAHLDALARRVTRTLAGQHLVHGQAIAVPASIGTRLATPGERVEHVIGAASQAMHTAKRLNAGIPTRRPRGPRRLN
jgi:diguanylate cyclase (GGDEF)-like protein